MSKIVRAIDVGYGNTKYVLSVGERGIRCDHFPSIAALSKSWAKKDAIGGTRRTVAIQIDGLVYEVGKDVSLVGNIFQARQMDDRYCERPEYLALIRGALHGMNLEHIDLLVLGLPVRIFKQKRPAAFLQKKLVGAHDLGSGRSVFVERVRVVAQPTGALVQFGHGEDRMGAITGEKSLIIDCGARTFDWLVTQGLRIIEGRSSSVNRGMYDVVKSLADGLGREAGVEITDFDRLDEALRRGGKPKINGVERDMSRLMKEARAIAVEAVAEMKHYVGNGHDIDNLILVGGGAFFFKAEVEREFPDRPLRVLDDAIYANVRGFQLAGMDLVKETTAAASSGDVTDAPAAVLVGASS